MDHGAVLLERGTRDVAGRRGTRTLPADDWPIVVVVDDDACLRELVGDWVEAAGFLPVRVEHGGSCVEAVKYLSPVAVIVDLHMEGMTGAATVSAIRAIDHRVHVIAATAETDPRALVDVVDAGADEILQKPIDRTTLVKMLFSSTSGRSLAAPLLA